MTPEEIKREIEGIGSNLPQSLSEAISIAANQAIESVRAAAPVDSTQLRSSIMASVNDDLTLGISMVDYGFFQNFGVAGTSNIRTVLGVPTEVANVLPPSRGNTYSFDKAKSTISSESGLPFKVRQSIHQKGLEAKKFLDLESFVTQVAQIVNQNLEL